MPTPTYTLVASSVLSTSASSVVFTGISSAYRDLVVVVNTTGNPTNTSIVFNDVSNGFNRVTAYVSGTSITSDTSTSVPLSAYSSSESVIFNIFDYSITDKHKTVLVRSNNSANWVAMIVGRWFSTSAINKIELTGTYAAGNTFSIYGIVA